MEEPKAHSKALNPETSSNEDGITEEPQTPEFVARTVPDVPEDIDEWYQEHLNDPNYDYDNNRPPASIRSGFTSANAKKKEFQWERSDTESQYDRYSSTGISSRNSANIDFEDESPYPEVRASVSSVDDPSMPVNTFRMWFLALFFSIGIIFFNQIFAMRYPSVWLTGIVVQLAALPCGKAFERILPTTVFNFFGYRWSFNPGPFSIKEHVCITVMANAASYGLYVAEASLVQRVFYGSPVPYSFQILIALGCQTFGFSLGGLIRQFVVYPSSMIWPGALVNSALFNTLHKNYGTEDNGHMSRLRFFGWVCLGSFIWYWVPGYIFVGLSMFNWICWIVPNNVTVNALFGVSSGLGMSVLTFDWSMIAFIGSPLVTPWWSEMNTLVGFVFFFWIVCPILYFTNAWDFAYMPISSYFSYDNTGMMYQVKDILTDGVFDAAKYEAYSPVFLSCAHALAYGIQFAALPALLVHTVLWFRKDIVRRFRGSLKNERDVHSRLMQYYAEVPVWWYAVVAIIAIVFMIVAVEINDDSQLPAWGILLACAIGAILVLPVAMIQAITNQVVTTQIMAQLIIGYILPGRPIANMIYKAVGYSSVAQAVSFAGDLKLGHYMKVPPRVMFSVQIIGAIVTCFFVTLMQNWMLSNIPDVCTPGQKDGFRCPGSNTFFTASVIWGSIGPAKIFSIGKMYSGLLWFFPIGAVLPIPFYFLSRRYPLSFWRYINIPIFFAGLSAMPPGSGINYISWALVGFIFNYLVRKYHFRWWMRYNYILSAGLDAGLAIAMIVVFFCLYMPKGGIEFNWWGNTVWYMNADGDGLPLRMLGEGETFGPSSW